MAESEAAFERAFIATQVCVEVDHAIAAGLCPTISITITGQSVARLPDLVGWLLEAGLPSRVSFYRERARQVAARAYRCIAPPPIFPP